MSILMSLYFHEATVFNWVQQYWAGHFQFWCRFVFTTRRFPVEPRSTGRCNNWHAIKSLHDFIFQFQHRWFETCTLNFLHAIVLIRFLSWTNISLPECLAQDCIFPCYLWARFQDRLEKYCRPLVFTLDFQPVDRFEISIPRFGVVAWSVPRQNEFCPVRRFHGNLHKPRE